jgi:hypothetical protein
VLQRLPGLRVVKYLLERLVHTLGLRISFTVPP